MGKSFLFWLHTCLIILHIMFCSFVISSDYFSLILKFHAAHTFDANDFSLTVRAIAWDRFWKHAPIHMHCTYTHNQLEPSKCIILSILFWSKHFFTTLIGHDLSLFWVWPHYSNPNNAQTNINSQPTYDLAIKHFRFEENP